MQYDKKISLTIKENTIYIAEDLIVKIGLFYFIIPAGFETDLASVPRGLQWLFYPLSWWLLIPSVIHDYLYREKKRMIKVYYLRGGELVTHRKLKITRKLADGIFLQKMGDFGSRILKYPVYYAVRHFGKIAWSL